MKHCECCDHPLEHAIAQALDAFENGRPIVTTGAIVRQLRQNLADWRLGRREQASADAEVWPDPETCGECGHEPHEGACKEWVVNHTFGTGGLDQPCQCSQR